MPIAVCCQFLSLKVPHRRKAACEMLKNDTITKQEDKGPGKHVFYIYGVAFYFSYVFRQAKML